MRKLFLFLSVCLLGALTVSAQEQDKKAMTLRIGEFEWLDPVKPSEDKMAEIIEIVKAKVAEAATASKRFEVLDLAIADSISKYYQSEAFANLPKEEFQREIMQALNDNTVFGKITKCKFTKRTAGAMGYTCIVTLKLDVANALSSNAEILESRSFISNFKKMVVKNTPEAALDDALQSMTEKMTDFFANNFAVFGAIDKIKDGDAIITCGQQQGVKDGDEFQVTLATFQNGALTEKPIGIVKVKALMADGTSVCNIKDGKDAIVENNTNRSQNQWLRCKLILK